MQQIFY
jgi:hypothetical protein